MDKVLDSVCQIKASQCVYQCEQKKCICFKNNYCTIYDLEQLALGSKLFISTNIFAASTMFTKLSHHS